METHEANDLLKDLHVMESHFNNATEQLQKLKTRLDKIKAELMKKK
jgi:hypothetical protein